MGLELDIYSFTKDELEEILIPYGSLDIISMLVEKPTTSINLNMDQINLPIDSVYYRKKHSAITDYIRTRFSVDEVSSTYIGRLRFVYNTITKDLKRLEKRKPLQPHKMSQLKQECGCISLADIYEYIFTPSLWDELLVDLAELKNKLAELMKQGVGDNYIFAHWIT